MRGLIGNLLPRARRSDWAGLVDTLRGGATYLSQGASFSYLRARTLLAGPKLFQDDDFVFALNICKWEGFAMAAQDLILILEADLRPALPEDAAQRGRGLAALYREVLEAEGLPDHRSDSGWDDVIEEFHARLPVFLERPPLKPDAISIATALRLLQHAPVDDAVREADKMMVVNNVAFRFIEYQAKMRETLDLEAVASELGRRMLGAT